jgi:ParB/RepB/Spo0J family partition protein
MDATKSKTPAQASPAGPVPEPGKVLMLKIDELHEDPNNTRKTVDKDEEAELAASIRTQGILQPLLVRSRPGHPDGYQVVDGNRRLRAARAGGLKVIPCLHRGMTDADVKEAQLVTVLQRAELAGLEEAEAYKELIDKHGYDVRTLAAKIGRSPAYVYGCFRLLKLSPKWKKALKAGEVSEAVVAVVAQLIEDHATQEALYEDMRWELDDPDLDATSMREVITRKWMLDLKKAPWNLNDAQLVAAAGACGSCPKRSQAQGDLLGDTGKNNFCMDSTCFKGKQEAHAALTVKRARAEGKTVLTGDEAEKAIKEAKDSSKSELVILDSSPNWWAESGNLREALKGKKVPVAVYAQGKSGQLQELVTRKEFYEALPKRSKIENLHGTGGQPRAGKLSAKEKAERRARLLDLKAKAAAWPKAVDMVVSKLSAKGVNLAMMKFMAHIFIKHHGDHHLVNEPGKRMGIKSDSYSYKNAVANHLGKAKTEKEVLAVIWNTALGAGLWDTSLTDAGKELFSLAGVDWKAMKSAEAKAITAAREAKLKARAEKGGAPKPAPKPAAKKKGKR